MSTLASLILFASEAAGHESSKAFYYIAGGGLTLLALVVSFVGIKGHEGWPGDVGVRNAVMAVVGLAVAVTMVSTIVTS